MSSPQIELSGPWELTHFPQESLDPEVVLGGGRGLCWIAAEVPGNVVLDLHRAGQIDDPYVGMNPEQVRPFEYHEWWYRTTFTVNTPAPAGGKVNLVFEGIDTFAEIYLDGRLLGRTENMFVPHRFPLAPTPKSGATHTLHVRIKSDQYEVARRDFNGVVELIGNDPSRVWIRKAAYTHGWDIFPRLLSAGIWKRVCLEYQPAYFIDDVFVFTRRFDRAASSIMARVYIRSPRAYRTDLAVRLRVREAGRVVHEATHAVQETMVCFAFELERPRLWWPRPYGEPFLYQVRAELLAGDEVIDGWDGQFGVRSVEIAQEPLADGRQSFYFKINDEPISIYGTNHVPLDSCPSRYAQRLQPALELLDDSRCNMVRVWGGGVYETPEFYAACARMGVMVWQDFMFACALYPQEEAFLAQVHEEARHAIRSLRNHPSVVLYCGDNEIELHLSQYFGPHQLGAGNRQIANALLPELVMRHDGTRPYIPSSPFTPIAGEPPYSVKGGDTHIWCHGTYFRAPVYSEDLSPFISEIGHLSLAARESIEKILPAEAVWPRDERLWSYRAGCLNDPAFYTYPHGWVEVIDRNITNMFGELPAGLDDRIFASQVVQAEAYKAWVERARRRKFDCGGILWWNLLDGCPLISNAVVDFYFRKTIAYEYIRRAQDDLLFCIEKMDGELELFLVSDSLEEREVSYQVVSGDEIIAQGLASVPANGVVALGSAGKAAGAARLFLLRAEAGDRAYFNHYLDGEPPFDLDRVKGFHARIEAEARRAAPTLERIGAAR
ncbi:MAG TPA: hypothetical protein PLS90_10065 [Candidatus Sumerlaeota bacterium]|nr:hypothetical protein [Candidatus Sumerlaeota bacterium]